MPATRAVFTRGSPDATLAARQMRFGGAVCCVAAMVCFAGAGTARAAPDETRVAEARQHYAAATKFYDLAEYEGALREFKEAYRSWKTRLPLQHRAVPPQAGPHAGRDHLLSKLPAARAPGCQQAEVERLIAELERAPAAPPPDDAPPAAEAPVAPLVLDPPGRRRRRARGRRKRWSLPRHRQTPRRHCTAAAGSGS